VELRGGELPEPGEFWQLQNDADWIAAITRYVPNVIEAPLRRCFDVARESGAKSLIIETRYIDRDYRSEYSHFFSKAFQPVSDCAHRLHFFEAQLTSEQVGALPPADELGYLGYVVVRPSTLGTVGRTNLRPPPELRDCVTTAVVEKVNLYGRNLEVKGVPFVQQDAQLGRCAHAAAWITHYSAHLRGDVPHRTMAEFSLEADASLAIGRPLPSQGLTVQQLSELLRAFGLPAIFYPLGALPHVDLPWNAPPPVPPLPAPPPAPPVAEPHPGTWDTRVVGVAKWFLDSGYPVMICTRNHAMVLCGYFADAQGLLGQKFVRHDDQRGPYLVVDNPLMDHDPASGHPYGPWTGLLVPLPEKLWMAPEAAELVGGETLFALSAALPGVLLGGHTRISEGVGNATIALRTYAIRANDFKAGLAQRGVPEPLASEYRVARFSRFVWVVEAVLKDADPDHCVLGEAIFDATSSDFLPKQLALHAHGVAAVWLTSEDDPRQPIVCSPEPYRSGGCGKL
jgi:hypothetical protein